MFPKGSKDKKQQRQKSYFSVSKERCLFQQPIDHAVGLLSVRAGVIIIVRIMIALIELLFKGLSALPALSYLISTTVLGGAPFDQGGDCNRENLSSFLRTTHEATGGKGIWSKADIFLPLCS